LSRAEAPVPKVEDEPNATMTTGPPAASACATCGKFISTSAGLSLMPQPSIVACLCHPIGAAINKLPAMSPSTVSAMSECWVRSSAGVGGFDFSLSRSIADRS
jgi:hypothetical protein